MDPNSIAKEQAVKAYLQHMQDIDLYAQMAKQDAMTARPVKNKIAEVLGVNRQTDNSIVATVRILEDALNNEAMFQHALADAISDTIRAVAGVILNERKAEIEAACNFEDLRDVLAAELARQFMASRLMGTPTPFDKPQPIQASQGYGNAGTSPGGLASSQLKFTP